MPSFSQLRLSPAAKALADQVLGRAGSTADRRSIEAALVTAAQADSNRVLSVEEVEAVLDGFEQAAPGGGVLSAQQLGVGLDLAQSAAGSMASLSNVDGISAHFTFQESLETKLVGELDAAVAKANGRPLDVNMMIFEFQSDVVEQAIARLAKANPNVTFRIIGDSGQASASGGNALPALLAQSLPNVQVKFKKDFPYVWSESAGRPVYNHGASKGLNHHKGFSTVLEGESDRLVTGSFNWSATADTKNYEDLTVYRAVDSGTRRAVDQYTDEFQGFWNDDDACLSPNDFSNFKDAQWSAMSVAHGRPPSSFPPKPSDALPRYERQADLASIDLNGYRPSDASRLETLVGKTLAGQVRAERSRYGRFTSVAELLERVPGLTSVSRASLERLTFGSGQLSLNTASYDELDALGFSKADAKTIVDARVAKGDFESFEQVRALGVNATTFARLQERLTVVDVEGFFNSRQFSATVGGTGYGSGGVRQTPVAGAGGVVANAPASVVVGATDLFNRAGAGEAISLAMYGMSPSSPEFRSLEAAARRGVTVRVVLNDDFSESTVKALAALKAQGLPVEVRVQTAKTMHEKFGVVGDDVFSGSANFSESSSTKHSEDRFTLKNHKEIAAQFQSQFELLWARSKVMT